MRFCRGEGSFFCGVFKYFFVFCGFYREIVFCILKVLIKLKFCMPAYRQERMDNMKKITNKKYEAIIQAKNIISQLCEDGAMDYVESGVDVVRNTCLMKAPALLKEALLTVLTSGTISDNGFQMPATACCCENFAVVRKQMKRPFPEPSGLRPTG